jgi:hypothetical protein
MSNLISFSRAWGAVRRSGTDLHRPFLITQVNNANGQYGPVDVAEAVRMERTASHQVTVRAVLELSRLPDRNDR